METSGFLLLADTEVCAAVNSCFYHGFLFAEDCQGYQSLCSVGPVFIVGSELTAKWPGRDLENFC